MNKLLVIVLCFMVCASANAGAPDRRISDEDGHVLNINSDGTIPVSLTGGSSITGGCLEFTAANGGNGEEICNGTNDQVDIKDDDGTVYASFTSSGIDLTASNIKTVGCSDSLQTAIDDATAGDTLLLGACDYAAGSGITISKAISLVSLHGPYKTQITDTAGTAITVTADDFHMRGIGVVNTGGGGISISCESGTTCQNISISDFYINLTSASNAGADGILFSDASFTLDNGLIEISSTMDGTDQSRGVYKRIQSSNEADTTCTVNDVTVIMNANGSSSSALSRAFFIWNNGSDASLQTQTCEMRDIVAITIPADTDDQTEAFQNQGSNTISNVFGGYIDGIFTGTAGGLNRNVDYRIDDGAEANFRNVIFGRDIKDGSGTVTQTGFLGGYGITGVAPPQAPSTAAPSSGGHAILSLTGQQGGDNTDTASGETASTGGGVTLTGGAGGETTVGSGTATGGVGGPFTFTGGKGGDQTNTTATTNVGGAGGAFTFTGGAGGDSTGATNNNGGVGGALALTAGKGGTGTGGATGAVGGAVTIKAGQGGGGTNTGGTGGNLTIAAGAGGNSTADGVGGDIIFQTAATDTLTGVAIIDQDGRFRVGSSTAGTLGHRVLLTEPAGGDEMRLGLESRESDLSVGEDIAEIDFIGADTQLTTQRVFARILVEAGQSISTDAAAGDMVFYTTGTTVAGSPVERLRLEMTGEVVVAAGGLVPDLVTADPCGSGYPEGSIFYNNTSNYMCYCNGTADVKMSDDSTACF